MNISSSAGCPLFRGHSSLPLTIHLCFPHPPHNNDPKENPPLFFQPTPALSDRLPAQPNPPDDRPLRRPLRVLLMGDRHDVLTTIQNLHKRGFADAGEWSVPLPYPQSNPISQFIPRPNYPIVISVHTQYIS